MATNRDDELRAQGWKRACVAGEPRLSELVDTYREIGYEVRLEPFLKVCTDSDCTECFKDDKSSPCMVIYTRKKS